MKSNLIMLVLAMSQLVLVGCGGGSGSSSTQSSPNQSMDTPSSSPDSTSPPSNNLSNVIEVNPLRDLGLDKGDQVCFRIKSYNNVEVSDFSKPICSKIKNSTQLMLSWNDADGNVIGYYVYFGSSKKKVNEYLADVIES